MLVFLSVLLATILLVSAIFIVRDSENGGGNRELVTLQIGFMETVDSLNPYVGWNDASYIFYGMVYDPLFSVDQDLNPAPNLALSAWIVPETDPSMIASGEPYGSVWQYNLTHNAYWHDGERFSAEDVVWNINLNAENHQYMWAYQPFSYFMKTAEALDNYTVRIHFWDRATGDPIPVSWGRSFPIPMLPKHLLLNYSASRIGMNWTGAYSDSESPGLPLVGTGPFMATSSLYTEWLRGSNMTLVRNTLYHQTIDNANVSLHKEAHFDRVSLEFYDDSTAITLALLNRELDVAKLPPAPFQAVQDKIQRGETRNVVAMDGPDPTGRFVYYSFNVRNPSENPSTKDQVIRTALHLATNKEHIVDNFYLGYADVGSTLVSPANSQWHYEPNETEKAKFAYNLTAAAELLQANGYVDIDSDQIRECTLDSPAVQLGYVSEGEELTYTVEVRKENPEEKDTASYLKSQWAQIGVDLSYVVVDIRTLSSHCSYCYPVDQKILSWSADVDPNFILFPQTVKALYGWSDVGYSTPEYEESFNQSTMSMEPTARKGFVDDCQRIFYNDSAYIVLAYPNSTYAFRNDTFVGWGDWTEHPGRNLDSYWGANQLLFDLMPVSPVYVYDQVNYGSSSVLYIGPITVATCASVGGLMLLRLKPSK